MGPFPFLPVYILTLNIFFSVHTSSCIWHSVSDCLHTIPATAEQGTVLGDTTSSGNSI